MAEERKSFLGHARVEADHWADPRSVQRHSLMVRPARLISRQGEFVCLIRDISSKGTRVSLFHDLPTDNALGLEILQDQIVEVMPVWQKDLMAGFEFAEQVATAPVLANAQPSIARALRLQLFLPASLIAADGTVFEGHSENISQQGARIACDGQFALDQRLTAKIEGVGERLVVVRWREEGAVGVVFEETLSLRDFALMAVDVQCPMLVKPNPNIL